jgi:nucleoid-associated protein YgaU
VFAEKQEEPFQERRKPQMGVRYTVRRGDSLWSLAGRYLGDYTRFQDICDYHDEHAQRHATAAGRPLIAITD